MAYQVVFQPDDISTEAGDGELLLAVADRAGLSIASECGGHGVCHLCRVIVQQGQIRPRDQDEIIEITDTPREVLACQTQVAGDIVVQVPVESRVADFAEAIAASLSPPAAALLASPLSPLVQTATVKMPSPTADDPEPDRERLNRAILQQQPDWSPFTIDLPALRRLPLTLRDADFHASVTVADEGHSHRIIQTNAAHDRPLYGLALDIGTSTLAAEIVNLGSGAIVAAAGLPNQQFRYGADVITRIIWSQEHSDGLEQLHQAIIDTIAELLQDLCQQCSIEPEQIMTACCAGNATMISLLLQIPPDPIRHAPHIHAAEHVPVLSAHQVGLPIHPQAPIFCMPAVSGYVGGDITAGILAMGLFATDKLSLLVDVGTNGEIVVGNKDWMMCASCSAGPAFEGAGIDCAVHATSGAIQNIDYDPEDECFTFVTIGQTGPVGLCGSGLLELLATLWRAGVIDRGGKFNEELDSPRMRERDGQPEFVILWSTENATGRDLALQQADIENLLRSKAAIYAGITTLLDQVQIPVADIEQIYLAGAFGSHLNITDAITLGIIPDIPTPRVAAVGNTSLAGAYLALLARPARERAANVVAGLTYIDLSAAPQFMDEFIASMFLPHTDLSRFPSADTLNDKANIVQG